MKRILKFKLSEELVDIENNKGKMLYHFIVTNEVDRWDLDKLMIFFESTLTNKEILNRSEIIGVTGKVEHAIPTNIILGIFTFEDKKVLEEYKKQKERKRRAKIEKEIEELEELEKEVRNLKMKQAKLYFYKNYNQNI